MNGFLGPIMEDTRRYFPNLFPDYNDKNLFDDGKLLECFRKFFLIHIRRLFQHWESKFQFDPNDTSVYTGSTGAAILYLKFFEQNILDEREYCLKKAKSIIDKSFQCKRKERYSFLCGQTGVLATKALINHRCGLDYVDCLKQIENIILNKIDNEDLPDELLYGRSGILYSLLLIRSGIENSKESIQDGLIRKVVETILKSGQSTARQEKSKIPLVYYWHEKGYVGAAHGYAGILTMLLQASQFLTDHELNHLIKPTIDFVYELRFPQTGNFPSSLTNEDDRLVHWCHGSPGVIHMLVLAYKHFNDQKYLDAAIQACDDIWQRGLLKKGCGLCHGVAGNAYAFIRMFQLTEDQKYLYRALKFAEWCCDYDKHRTRIPDRPYSLFEGLAGTIYFLVDILNPQQCRFPAFQI